MEDKKIDQIEIVNFLKQYGFVYASSEIYNGLANAWDYGPLGVLLKNNIKKIWWQYFITSRSDMFGLDSAILLNPSVWKASGHLANFSDPLIDCKNCGNRFRADKLILQNIPDAKINENTDKKFLYDLLVKNNIQCPICKKSNWTEIRNFNLLFKTSQGVVENKTSDLYLRPETAQGIFINFANILRTTRAKLPFGVGQIGKAFRNEITPGNFIFRTREFEQMEIEHFCLPNSADDVFEMYLKRISTFLFDKLHLDKNNIHLREHAKQDLSHYSSRTIDFEFLYPHGWAELWGLANRTNFDLKNHQMNSGKNLDYLDEVSKTKVIPYVIEPSVGVERLFYAIICNCYKVEQIGNDQRQLLSLSYDLCPYKIAIFPLSNKLSDQAMKIYRDLLQNNISCCYDASGSIGKRYRRQDAIGTYYCLTVDFDTANDQCVTIRYRDSMKQERIKISDILNFLSQHTS